MGEEKGDRAVDVLGRYAHVIQSRYVFPFKYWDSMIKLHLGKKILLLKKSLKTIRLHQVFLNLAAQQNY